MNEIVPRFVLSHLETPHFRFVLVKSGLVVGRRSDCDIVIADPSVSRRHAELHIANDELQVVDLGSTHGTFVVGKRIQTSRVVAGVVIRFGNVEFTVTAWTAEMEGETGYPGIGQNEQTSDSPSLNQICLSFAQTRVLKSLLKGFQEKEIASELGLSVNTVHNHTKAIYKAYGVHTRSELLLYCHGIQKTEPK